MSARHRIERHVHALGEIREIMNAMRNLAVIENRKLARVLQTQRRVLESVSVAASDFGRFHPELRRRREPAREVCLVVGSERGFCGDFNDGLLRAIAGTRAGAADRTLLLVGSKLAARAPEALQIAERLPGAATLEDVPAVLLGVMQALERWHASRASGATLRLAALHYRDDGAGVDASALDPFDPPSSAVPDSGHPPLLYLPPQHFLQQLAEHYVFAALHDIFYRSLAVENERRIQHMDTAARRVEQKMDGLQRRLRSLRQEDITEEIEIILLSAEAAHADV